MKGHEKFLDLERETLIGWEVAVNDKLVNLVMEGIRLGFQFPRLVVYNLEANIYCLDPNYMVTVGEGFLRDGGHTRAVDHLLYPAKMKAYVKANEPPFFPDTAKDIRDILIIADEAEYKKMIEIFPKYKQMIAQMQRR
jgi:hypothetical protein